MEYIDHLVASGGAPSRAAVIRSAVEADLRRALDERDLAVIRAEPDDGLKGLAEWAQRLPREELD